ncbi:MAG TPA: KUP/HAK/KT family potassium transporter [Prolixibacteraceae bacterium]|nr:KUP/HAK/KT family potassium transporter [Prolixibacteraceae bacterium]
MQLHSANKLKKLSIAGVIISLGIVFGDIGTSPLYVLKAFLNSTSTVTPELTLGILSCIIWTLTMQTTIKYVLITLKADNRGEGGIFSLFALLRRRRWWLFIFAIIGGSTMLADGIIAPSITVLSAVEGLTLVNPQINVLLIAILIISLLFFIQQFGTAFIGKSFGPIMFVWFSTLGTLGTLNIVENPEVLRAFNPYYAFNLLANHPGGFLLLGAVFLCTTGAEALYADLGHCGLKNIRTSWAFVKCMLILNYLGQGSWIIRNIENITSSTNPFYAIMPQWFLPFGVILATMAAIIASQASITGSYTLISEAISLNFWPKIKIKYPSHAKGQMYVPSVCIALYTCCLFVILSFRSSSALEAAYGLAITITMLMTSVLVVFYLLMRKKPIWMVLIFALTYFTIEGSFLISNFNKFSHGGWFTITVGSILTLLMLCMYHGRKVRNRFISFYKIESYLPIISDMRNDEAIPKFAGHLVYTTHANSMTDLEAKTIDSIINRNPPKRADHYWFLHVDIVDDPYLREYKVTELWPGEITRIDFYLGFKVQPRINEYFKQVLEDLSLAGSVDLLSTYPSLRKHNILSVFTFVHIDRTVIKQTELAYFDGLTLNMYYLMKRLGLSDIHAYGLEANQVVVERIPLTIPTRRSKIPIMNKRR